MDDQPKTYDANEFQTLKVEITGRVALLTLNRPDAMNALNALLLKELNEALDVFDADPGIGCVVVTGSEKAFAAGADIKEMKDKTYASAYASDFIAPYDQIAAHKKPLIAAVSGFALGGGMELAMLCDMIIASETAQFGQPEITLGIMPGAGGTQRLSRAVGKAKAMDLCLTGRRMDAAEAERAGLVARVVPPEMLIETAMEIGAKIASFSGPVTEMIKGSINTAFATPLAEGVRQERQLFYATFATEDQKEGMSAFLEKRKPDFKHR
ncbi:enoyl-CoA hydratase [Methyloligella sp. 2.7D]|uniref:enoyl-CoA hydratase n=1 Tax=unclassified Methyloligella TaxID=2625955 RepID=UPI00157DF9B9|nr:enoyl-CoA hydratase [Methyloligella sp. GL2]QKP78632.1 enoyl-CoA hydratase [Methyloligella sp. GL2]